MTLAAVREQFFKQYPAAGALDRALRTKSNPNPVFFMGAVPGDSDLKGSALALLRLGPELERRFGINGEVAAYFVPWQDFQRRSFNAITLHTPDTVRAMQATVMKTERFTPSRRVALLVSTDPQTDVKLEEWQNDSFSQLTLVPIDVSRTPEGDLRQALASSLRNRLGERDLYQTQNPVSGIDFFGRAGLLKSLSAAVDGDQNVAILGLRRSGKTSVLQELRRVLLPKHVVMPIADFQMLETQTAGELLRSISSSLNEELKIAKARGIELWIGNEAEQDLGGLTAAGLSDRIKRVAARNSDIRIVIAVDEVETAASIARKDPESIKVLLGTLRSVAQARGNVSLLFCGVANRMFRSSTLGPAGDIDNPMFNQVKSIYLTPFSLEETGALLQELGRPMLLRWDEDAVLEVHRMTGGFPFFVRDLASSVRKSLRAGPVQTAQDFSDIEATDVLAESPTWSANALEAWVGIVRALGIHYPAAAALLDASLTEAEITEWVAGDPEAQEASEDLIALDLFKLEQGGLRYSPMLAAFQALSTTPPDGGPALPNQQLGDGLSPLAELVRQGESHVLEFKETSRINLKTMNKDARMEDAVVKTVAAFLNTEGGNLLIGIADDGSSKGLDLDLQLFAKSLDRFERWLTGDLLAKRIDHQLVADLVRTQLVSFRGKNIMQVTVSRSHEPAWVDDKTLYRRLGNQTTALESGRDLQQFLAQRQERRD